MRGGANVELAIIDQIKDNPTAVAVAGCAEPGDTFGLQSVDDALDARKVVCRAVAANPCHEVELCANFGLRVRGSDTL